MSILLTGSNGFVGSRLVDRLATQNLICAVRKKGGFGNSVTVGDITSTTDWSSCFELGNGVKVVIHCAARVHIMGDQAADPLTEFREVNTFGTLKLARQAAAAGVKRFVFISSIKVNGESTELNKPYHYNDPYRPEDPYGQSKAEAENGLNEIARQSDMEVVIIRPPLVYGPGVKANFASMIRLASRNLPLPLGAISNKRSLVALDNLVDLIVTCIDHPKAANQTFLVSDDRDVSTTELLEQLTIAAGNKSCLLPVPMKLIQLAAVMIGKRAIADRLCGSLQVDISHTKNTLGWVPPLSFEQGIARCFEK